jgi:hypothetical protein
MVAAMNCQHTLHHAQGHRGWNNANAPILRIAPGESIEFQALDASDGQLTPQSVAEDLTRLDFERVNPVVGPVFIDGAAPGDVIKVTLLDFTPSGWGWTGNIPGFGLLADQFPAPHLHHWHYDVTSRTPALYGPGGRVPLEADVRHHWSRAGGSRPAFHRAAATRGRQHGHPRSRRRHRALPAGGSGRRPVQSRRRPCRAGRWRDLRHRHRNRLFHRREIRTHQAPAAEDAALHHARGRYHDISTARATKSPPASART